MDHSKRATRPSNLIYSVDEKPPVPITFANAAQQLTIVAPVLVYIILVMRGAGLSEEGVAHAVSITSSRPSSEARADSSSMPSKGALPSTPSWIRRTSNSWKYVSRRFAR